MVRVPVAFAFIAPFFAAALATVQPSSASPRFVGPRPALPQRLHKIDHIVVIIQENRTVDNLFNGFCTGQFVCADTVRVDPYTGTVLQPLSMAGRVSPPHGHSSFVRQYDGGSMTGFRHEFYAYVPSAEVAIYWQLATRDGVLADEVFQPNMGPSFPAHQYEIAGQSGGYEADHNALADNPSRGMASSCNARPHTNVPTIDMTSRYPGRYDLKYPCQDYQTIFDRLVQRGFTWRYYTHRDVGIWVPTQTVRHLFLSPNHIKPETRFFKDLAAGRLANVTYITPNGRNSDHPGYIKDPLAGPKWVGSLANAIGASPFWSSTAIVVTWDDWGGWYDHVRPPLFPFRGEWPRWEGSPNPDEYGFRTPLVLISPYARIGTIDHTLRSQAAILRLIEKTFALPSLNTLDALESEDLTGMLDLGMKPRPYVPV